MAQKGKKDMHYATTPVVLAIVFALALIPVVNAKATLHYTDVAWNYIAGDVYDLEQSKHNFETARAFDATNEQATYNLARIYYMTGDYEKAFSLIETYKEEYPENARIHYIAGLAHAYAGNLETAESEFTTFIASGISNWQGYLDLAWTQFRQGSFDRAQNTLEAAITLYGNNAWLDTSRGAVALAQGDNETAREYLTNARTQVDTITIDEWQANYSLNNPANFADGIAALRSVIETNIGYANGESTPGSIADALSASFASASPLGVSKGLAVSACGDSCGTIQCISAANVCGDINTGTQSTCGGACSASVPANPSGSCSVATACGVDATGYNGCNGQCNIVSYPFCTTTANPDGDAAIEWVTVGGGDGSDIGVTDVTCEIYASPTLVNSGGSTVVRWISTETDSASVTSSTGLDAWSGTIGEQLSSAVSERTTFTLTCQGYDESTVTDSVIVNVVPEWQEF